MTTDTKKPDTIKHTPGPWTAESRSVSDGSLVVKDHSFNEVCIIRDRGERCYGKQNDTDQANARLIASAPAMRAALERLAALNDSALAIEYVRGIARAALNQDKE